MPDDTGIVSSIERTLNSASSRTLDTVYDEVCVAINTAKQQFEQLREKANSEIGVHATNELIGRMRKHANREIHKNKSRVQKKLQKLTSSKKMYTGGEDRRVLRGSTKIKAQTYVRERDSYSERRTRPHRMKRGRGGKSSQEKKTSQGPTVTEEDLKKLDPIVLVNDLKLTQDQIAVCRLPDRFAPTPKQPMDVSDALIGSHQWGERLRWHYFHEQKKKLTEEAESQGKDNKSPEGQSVEEEQFTKRPWYQPTT